MGKNKAVIEIADNIEGLIALKAFEQKDSNFNKVAYALYQHYRDKYYEDYKVEKSAVFVELTKDQRYKKLYDLANEEIELKDKIGAIRNNWFSSFVVKKLRAQIELVNTQALEIASQLYKRPLLRFSTVLSYLEKIEENRENSIRLSMRSLDEIEARLLLIQDWDKKSFNELIELTK